jgi:hypothetical protein
MADASARRAGSTGRRVSPTRVRLRELSPPTAEAGSANAAGGAAATPARAAAGDELLRLRYLHHLTTQIKLSNLVRRAPRAAGAAPSERRTARAATRGAMEVNARRRDDHVYTYTHASCRPFR